MLNYTSFNYNFYKHNITGTIVFCQFTLINSVCCGPQLDKCLSQIAVKRPVLFVSM